MTNEELVIFNFRQRGIKTSNEKLGVFILRCHSSFASVILSIALWLLGLQPLVIHGPPCGEKDPGLLHYVVIKKITPAYWLGRKRELLSVCSIT
ncbi:MAG: hypothetical protein IKS97_04555 [Fibrobacter sp.]|nr:hypothetical protein [Fibrobacter sp.]